MAALRRALSLTAVLLCGAIAARGDGGAVRVSKQCGDYQVTVMTSPEPFRQGLVDVSVLVQDAATGAPATDTSVAVSLSAADGSGGTDRHIAERGAGTNKLFHSTTFVLPSAGWWHFGIELTRGSKTATLDFDAAAGPPLPRWQALWPWFTWPFLVIAVFAMHLTLVHRARWSRSSSKAPALNQSQNGGHALASLAEPTLRR